MNCIIFSKDRPLQLDCLLRSIYYHCDIFEVMTVLYTTKYKESYERLNKQYYGVVFKEEKNFKEDFLNILRDNHTCIFVDDDIVFREVSPFDVSMLMDEVDIVSLRLGDNIRKKEHFDYKSSVDGNIFPTAILKKLTHEDFINPNQLESKLRKYVKDKTMGWFKESRVVGIPANRVSDTSGCSHLNITTDILHELWLKGYVIDFQIMDLEHHNVHKNIDYAYKLGKNSGIMS